MNSEIIPKAMQIEELTDDFMKELLADFLRKTKLCMCTIKTFYEPYKGKQAELVKFSKSDGNIKSVKYSFTIYFGYSDSHWMIMSMDKSIENVEVFTCSLSPTDEHGVTDANQIIYALPMTPVIDKENMKVKIKSFLEQALEDIK